jgi:hypothetical protein
MGPRLQTAGTLGIVAGVALVILTILFLTSGASPEAINDPAAGISFLRDNAGRLRLTAYFAILTVSAATVFVAGLASALHSKTPTRGAAVLYFGLLGLAGHGLSAFAFLFAGPTLVAAAARDQIAASHAFVAVNALTTGLDGIGNFFIGLSTLMAGWAITASPGFGAGLGWFGVAAGVVIALAGVGPQVPVLYLGSFFLPAIWLIWAGFALRRSAA